MARIVGYDGGDSEEALLTALRERLATDTADAWERIREKDMHIGSIVEIAQARGYIKASRLKFDGSFVTKIGYGETYCRNCLHCWQKRRDFDPVREWVATTNTYKPDKLSGPLLFLDAHKAWSNRLKPDVAQKSRKKLTAKEWRQLAQAYRNMLDRSGGVIVQWAQEDGRDARDWNVIVQERAALEAEYSETSGESDFPVTATRDDKEAEQEEREDNHDDPDVPVGERYPGAPEPVEPDAVPETDQYPGAGFTVVGEINVPPRRRQRPQKPVLHLVNEHAPVETPSQSTEVATVAKPVLLTATPVTADDIAAITKGHGLRKWGGVTGDDDDLLYRKRAAYYLLTLESVSAEDDAVLCKLGKAFWREVRTTADANQRIPSERSKQASAPPRRRAKAAKQQNAAE